MGSGRNCRQTYRCIRNIKADQVILVDAGHGGVDSGMVGIGGLKEKGINLDIAMKLKTILEKKALP